MRIIEQLAYKITGETADFDKSINKTDKSVNELSKNMEKSSVNSNKLSTGLKAIGTGVTIAGAVYAAKKIFDISSQLVSASSEAEETKNKFNVTFSGVRDYADKTAENLSKNFGLSSQKAEQLLSDTGDLLTGFGFTQEGALDLSTQVNELAVDLASFTNYSGGAEGASAALTKALLGERESIKSLGISISEADIKQLAEDKGIVGEIDRQTKAQLTLELAVKQSKNAIGDFERSEDSFANQTRILNSKVEDLRVELGDRLLPTFTNSVKIAVNIVDQFSKIFNETDKLDDSYNDLEIATKHYNDVLADTEGKSEAVTAALIAQAKAARSAALSRLSSEYEDANAVQVKYQKTIDNTNKQIEISEKLYGGLARELGSTIEELSTLENGDDYQVVKQMGLDAGWSNDKVMDFVGTLKTYNDRIDTITKAQDKKAKADITEQQFIDNLTAAYLNNDEAAMLLFETYPKLKTVVMGNVEAYKKQQEAQEKATQRAKESYEAISKSTDLSNREAEALVNLANIKIKASKSDEEREYWAKTLSLAQEALNSNEEKATLTTKELAEQEANRTTILNDLATSVEEARNLESVLGDKYDENTALSSIYMKAIEDLIKNGEDPQSAKLSELVGLYRELNPEIKKSTENLIGTSGAIDYLTNSGLLPAWLTEVTEKTEELSKATTDWGNVTNQALNSIASTWGYLNDVQANAHEEELTRLTKNKETADTLADEELEKKLEIMEAEGASDKEMDLLKEQYLANETIRQEALDEKKNEFAEEESKRQKSLASFQALIGAAQAITQVWTDPTLPTLAKVGLSGLAGASVLAQLNAINSAPVPSYAVGTMDIPFDQTADLHKGETVLTAGITKEMKTQGITIEPKNKSNTSEMTQINVYLGSKMIASEIVKEVNTGKAGKIDIRVVK